jgi:hypothetical protein
VILKNATIAVFLGANCIKINLSGWQRLEVKMDGLSSLELSSVVIWSRIERTTGINETRSISWNSG